MSSASICHSHKCAESVAEGIRNEIKTKRESKRHRMFLVCNVCTLKMYCKESLEDVTWHCHEGFLLIHPPQVLK